jgi:hypothetical protein
MSACEMLNLGYDELNELHACMLRVVALGTEMAIVRARNREVIAAAEREGAEWPTARDTIISRRLRRADLGVVTRKEIDLEALGAEVRVIERILERAFATRWDA